MSRPAGQRTLQPEVRRKASTNFVPRDALAPRRGNEGLHWCSSRRRNLSRVRRARNLFPILVGEYLAAVVLRDGGMGVVSPIQNKAAHRFSFTWWRFDSTPTKTVSK